MQPRTPSPSFLRFWPWPAAAASGFLLAACFAPWEQSGVIWMALAPLIAAMWLGRGPEAATSWRFRAGLGLLAGLASFLSAFYWLWEVTTLGWVVVCLYLACYPALWAAIAPAPGNFLGSARNLLVAARMATAWVGLEWIRGWLFSGFGWNNLGVGLHANLAFIQIASITGVAGISFVVVVANAILVATLVRLVAEARTRRARPHLDFSLTVALVAALFLFGLSVLPKASVAPISVAPTDVSQASAPAPATIPLRVALIQGAIPQDRKWDPLFEESILADYQSLSMAALGASPDLLVWPEAATPRPLMNDATVLAQVQQIAGLGQFDFLVGSTLYGGASLRDAWNVAVLMPPGSNREFQVYRKVHLVPFGEFIPFRNSFPLFAWIAGDLVPGDFLAGTSLEPLRLTTQPLKFAPLICFEDTLPDQTRRAVLEGADFLANLTNDGWFRRSAASRQHLNNAIFRCVENRRPMLRSANSGITCLIDPWGRVTQQLNDGPDGTFARGFLSGTLHVQPNAPTTFFTRYGEWFALTCLVFTVLDLLARAAIRMRSKRGQRGSNSLPPTSPLDPRRECVRPASINHDRPRPCRLHP